MRPRSGYAVGVYYCLSNPQSPLAYPCRQIGSKSYYYSHTPQNLTDLFGYRYPGTLTGGGVTTSHDEAGEMQWVVFC